MCNRLFLLFVVVLLIIPLLWSPLDLPVNAQSEVQGWTTTSLNLRSGPGTTYKILTVLPTDQGLIFEAQSSDSAWLLGHTEDGAYRGWLTKQYVNYQADFSISTLAVSAEIINQTTTAPSTSMEASTWTNYQLNLRAGPGKTYDVLGTLATNTTLIPEARSADLSWLLAHTPDGTQRGWVASLYLHYSPGFTAALLPISAETLAVTSISAADSVAPSASEPGTAATLMTVPVLPSISWRAREILQGSGNDAHIFLKIGDCNSEYWEFLGPLDSGEYNLGAYSYLQSTVDFFRGSWGSWAITAHGGFNVLAELDPFWTTFHPKCTTNETPLACELRTQHPAIAVMMFGPNDVAHLSAEQYESTLRQVVAMTIDNGTIPVLTTFTWCQTGQYHEKGLQFNVITVNVAREYDIPLINFWRAAQGLPNCGLLDATHLSKPVMTTTGYFDDAGLLNGHTVRNLLTLQTLDAIRTSALQ